MKRLLSILMLTAVLGVSQSGAQQIAVKTNLLYGAYTLTPNLSLEFGLGGRNTLEIGGGYNPWNRSGSNVNNKKLVHWLAQAEYRRWLCQPYSGHFFGIHLSGTQYNIAGHELPMLFGKGSASYRYEGYGYGAGVSYGYDFFLGKRWNLEINAGAGYMRLNYDKYDCVKCGRKIGPEVKNYFGVTKAGISLAYIIK